MLSVSIMLAGRDCVEASAALLASVGRLLKDGQYKQEMQIDFTKSDGSNVQTLTLDSNGFFSFSSLSGNTGVFTTSCVDVCTDPDQLDALHTLEFTVDNADFNIDSRLLGNPCDEAQVRAGIPDMAITIEDAGNGGTCSNNETGLTSVSSAASDCWCFSSAHGGRRACGSRCSSTVIWSSSGATNSLSKLNDAAEGRSKLAARPATDPGATVLVHVEYAQDSPSAPRHLRPGQGRGDADVHRAAGTHSVLDVIEDAPADAPAKATPAEDVRTADIVTYLSGSACMWPGLRWTAGCEVE